MDAGGITVSVKMNRKKYIATEPNNRRSIIYWNERSAKGGKI